MLIGRDCASPAIIGEAENAHRRDRTGIENPWALSYPEQVTIARLLTRSTFLRAATVPMPDANIDAPTIRDHLLAAVESHRISKYAVPEIDRITFVVAIPKTSVGKIDKKVLRERNT